MSTALRIHVVSDVVCPFCFLGKRQLERAIEAMPELSFEVVWHPYLLDPTVPREGVDAAAYLKRRFGNGSAVRAIHDRILEMGSRVGIAFAFDRQTRRPNSLDAHRVIAWAEAAGRQNDVVDALFRAHFEQGKDLGDRAVLAAVAGEAGLDAESVRERLETDEDEARILAEADEARRDGITAVPSFFIGSFVVPGAQEPDVFVHVVRRALARGPLLDAR